MTRSNTNTASLLLLQHHLNQAVAQSYEGSVGQGVSLALSNCVELPGGQPQVGATGAVDILHLCGK